MVAKATVTRVGGGAEASDPCMGAVMPNVVGKTVKELTRSTLMIGGKPFAAISLVLSDGTRVLAASFKPGKGIGDPGIFVIADTKSCIFTAA